MEDKKLKDSAESATDTKAEEKREITPEEKGEERFDKFSRRCNNFNPTHKGFALLYVAEAGNIHALYGYCNQRESELHMLVLYGSKSFPGGAEYIFNTLNAVVVWYDSEEFENACIALEVHLDKAQKEEIQKLNAEAHTAELEKKRIEKIEQELKEWREHPIKKYFTQRRQVREEVK